MPDLKLPPPTLVQDPQAFEHMLVKLGNHERVALDTESNSLFAYQEQVCLIQFSIPGHDYLVDPLALGDLSKLDPLLRDGRVEKVLHGAEYDVLCLARDFNFRLNNLFDTRVASRTLGWKKSGLGDLIEQVFGVKIDKRFQRANWGKRPLNQEMLDYARLDTHFLLQLRDHLAEQLKQAGRWQECEELCQRMSAPPDSENGFDPQGFWRITHARDLPRRKAAILRELYLMRDKEARRLDRPPFKVMSDAVLMVVAKSMPTNEQALKEIEKLPSRILKRYGKSMLHAVQRGKSAPPPQKPHPRALDEEAHNRYEALRQWRKKTARQHNVESDLILPRDLMLDLAKTPPRKLNQLQRRMAPLDWRYHQYGQDILDILTNRSSHAN
ncbi:MAG: HRDC domain-containing protein [Anaerolineales bacterium]|jgi:ribonuclease D